MSSRRTNKRSLAPSPSPNQNAVPSCINSRPVKKARTSKADANKDFFHPYNTRSRGSVVEPLGTQALARNNLARDAWTSRSTSSVSSWKSTAPVASPVAPGSPTVPLRFLSPAGLVSSDQHNHLIVNKGDVIAKRYQVLDPLGEGTFGRVVAVRDLKKPNGPEFALKITQISKDSENDWEFERDILGELKALDQKGLYHFVCLHNAFMYHGHPCLVFEKLGHSLFKFLQTEPVRMLSLENIAGIGRQLCEAINFLHLNGLTHTDLKPENVVFVENPIYKNTRIHRHGKYTYVRTIEDHRIRVIDFGSAVRDDDSHGQEITTRQYRAPEAILELGWSHPIDVWSVGCILYEMYSTKMLFRANSIREQLAVMEIILGPVPAKMLKRSRVRSIVTTAGKFEYSKTEEGWALREKKTKPLKEYMRVHDPETIALFEVMSAMFRFEPRSRINMRDALRQRFFAISSR